MSPIHLIVGLGNPSPSYLHTRHNIGREFVEWLARDWGPSKNKKGLEYYAAPIGWENGEGVAESREKPLRVGILDCFMNESGPALAKLLYAENMNPQQILIILDDFMIPLGTLRLRMNGSAGGHNGFKSIIETLGTNQLGRLRMGIGPVPSGQDPADFVLQKFTKAEQAQLPTLFQAAHSGIKTLLEQGYEKAMTRTNKTHLE